MPNVTATTPAPSWTPAPAPARTAGIAALGVALPEQSVPNAPIAKRLGVEENWIVARTGVHERRRAAEDDTLDALAAAAGRAALERARLEPEELDLVLVATMTAEALLPNAAPLVAGRLGAAHAGAIDVGAACTGFLSGLALASAQVEAGRADHVLLVGADLMTRVTDPDDKRTAALFGDGAGAVVVSPTTAGGIGPTLLRADSSEAHCVTCAHDERLMRMRGQDTFRAAVTRLSECTLQAAAAADLTLADIDLFVYHQANGRILRAVGERLGLPGERVIDCTGSYGNTSAASVPIALAEADAAGMLQPGSRVLAAAFGAGFTWGAGVIEWSL